MAVFIFLCPFFSGNEEAGHLRRVGMSGVGWSRSKKSRSLGKVLRKMGWDASQGLEGSNKSPAELGVHKILAVLA